jgi:hypothetical protein
MFKTLSFENLQQKAPSIFAREGAAPTSKQYKHISTIEVMNGLMKEGFMHGKSRAIAHPHCG